MYFEVSSLFRKSLIPCYLFVDGMNHGSKYTKSEHISRDRSYNRFSDVAFSDTLAKPKVAFSTSIGSKDDTSGSDFYGAPYFGQTNTEVLVQEGNHAFFHCPVHNIRNQTVTILLNQFSFRLLNHIYNNF